MRRHTVAVALEPALLELMRLYDRLGGATPQAARELDDAIEACLGERPTGREHVHAHLQLLLRARELHGYAQSEPELISLKVRLYEHLLHHRTPAERWAAVRELLLMHLDRICEAPLPGLAGNVEQFKRALSDRSGRLGRLLLTVALFNQELEGEQPPPNLVLRFRRGAFPLHSWELCAPDGRAAHLGSVEAWSPESPLARWEYLATDLAHALFRRIQEVRATRQHTGAASPASWPAPQRDGDGPVYCRFDVDAAAEGASQLELLPMEPAALLAGLLRRAAGRHGTEGAKLLAVLIVTLAQAPAGTPTALALPTLAAAAGLGDATARGLRVRAQRLERLIGLLEQVELTRVQGDGSTRRAQSGRLLTVLGRSGGWPASAREEDAGVDVRVLADPYLCGPLGDLLAQLPPLLLESAGKAHPQALALYVWLRHHWGAAAQPAPLERTARTLLNEAGIWVSDAGRYRALEALRRELEFLREQGWLGTWKMQRSEVHDALEDRYRLWPPDAAGLHARRSAVSNLPRRALAGADRQVGTEALTGT